MVNENSVWDYNQELLERHGKQILPYQIDAMAVPIQAFYEDGNFITSKMGDFLLAESNFKTIKGQDKIYIYKNGFYHENGESFIKTRVTEILKDRFKKHHVSEVISYIKNMTFIDQSNIDNDLINFKNGLLNPITREFIPHTPDVFSLHQLDVIFDINARCPEFIKQLEYRTKLSDEEKRRWGNDPDWKLNTIQEMFGYCFLKNQIYEKAFLLQGEKRTWKSTLLFILSELLGKHSTTAIPLQQLADDRFAVIHLYGKLANICGDLTATELKNTGIFLTVTGQDQITAGHKLEKAITFSPYSKLIFSCNVIPGTHNKNPAFYRRWIVLSFNVQTQEDDVNPDMRNKMLEELAGIINWSLDGLERLLEKNKFSYPLTDADVCDLYERGSDSIQSFIYSEIDTEADELSLVKRNVYKKYREYCKLNKLPLENQIKFGRMFYALTGCGSKKIGTLPGYSGVMWKNPQWNIEPNLNKFTDNIE